jgi:MFS family permease
MASRISSAHWMLAMLSLSYTLSYFDRMLIVVVGEMVKAEFALSDKQLSLLTGAAFVFLYGVTGIVAGWLLDRHSRKRILVCSLAVWSAMTMACGFAQTFAQLALARAGVGVGEASNVPVALSSIADLYPPAQRPLAVAIFYTGGMAGMLATFMIGSWLAVEYGWRSAFLVAGPPGFVLAALIAWTTREPPREKPRSESAGALPEVGSWKLIRRNVPLLWLLTAGAVSTFANTGVVLWLPNFFIRSHHLDMSDIGFFFGPVLAGGMASGMMIGGWLGNRIAARSIVGLIRFCSWVLLALVPAYILLLRMSSLPITLALTFVTTSVSVLWSASYSGAWPTVCDPRARGLAAGIAGFGAALLGGAVCPFVVGVLSDLWAPVFGPESLRYALTASLIFCVLGSWLFARAATLLAENAQDAPCTPLNQR